MIVDESLLERACDHATRFLRDIQERHVGVTVTRAQLVAALRVPLSDGGEDATSVLDALARDAGAGVVGSAGPRYFGFVIGGSLPVTVAADWLTTAWDQNAGIYVTSPATSVVEDVAREWLLDLFDLPREAAVGFVTGCQMANFTSLAAARHGVLRRAGYDVEEEGLIGAPRVNVVVSAEAHVTILTAMRYLGFGTKSLHRVETDEQGRMRGGALRELLGHLNGPTIVCAQAGNVNSGAIDPLPEIIDAAHAHDAWVHVDSAFGLWGRAAASTRPLLAGIEHADSWATDAHKWLNVPYDSGIVIVRDAGALRSSMTLKAEYLEQTSGAERDNFDWVPEFSRRARGFTVYAAIRTLGRRGVEALVENGCARARQFASILGRDPRVKILNDVVLNQVLGRFKNDDAATRATIARVQEEGTCWLSGTTWRGEAAMRVSVSHWATSEKDVERSAEAILRCIP